MSQLGALGQGGCGWHRRTQLDLLGFAGGFFQVSLFGKLFRKTEIVWMGVLMSIESCELLAYTETFHIQECTCYRSFMVKIWSNGQTSFQSLLQSRRGVVQMSLLNIELHTSCGFHALYGTSSFFHILSFSSPRPILDFTGRSTFEGEAFVIFGHSFGAWLAYEMVQDACIEGTYEKG